jgi:hypothetical protein
VRIAVWLFILVLLCGLVYLNQVGLPGFIKQPLLERLRARGLELQFSRLRLSFYRGLLAENVRFGQAREPRGGHLTAGELKVQVDPWALAKLQLQVEALSIRKGRLAWPVPADLQPDRELSIEGIQTDLRFLPNDQWALDHFTAHVAGAQLQLSGTVTNASAVRDWKVLHSAEPAQKAASLQWQHRLTKFADTLQRIQFSATPDLKLSVNGDARDLQSFSVRLTVVAPGADTPWGTFKGGHFQGRLSPTETNGVSRVFMVLKAAEGQTPWASATNLLVELSGFSTEGQTNLASADITLRASGAHTRWASGRELDLKIGLLSGNPQTGLVNGKLALVANHLESRWARARNTTVSAEWIHSLTNPVPLFGQGSLRVESAATKWAQGRGIQFSASLATPLDGTAPLEPAAMWWTNLQPYALAWRGHVAELQSTGLVASAVSASGTWLSPELMITNLVAQLYEGQLDAHASLNVSSRAATAALATDFDPQKVAGVLTPGARRWLAQFTWTAPPVARGELEVILPAWANRKPDWRVEVQPTLQLKGNFLVPSNCTYRALAASSARSSFQYSNLCWHLPDLVVTRPEGRLKAEHWADDRTKDYYWRLSSNLDPRIIRPLLKTNEARALDLVKFTTPPWVEGEVRGRSREPGRTWFRGRAGITNFTFRGEAISGVQAELEYTNKVIHFFRPRLQRDEGQMSADLLVADFPAQRLYVTNGFSTVDPAAFARAVGPQIVRALEPYRFDTPPTVHGYGVIPMRGEEDADLHLSVDGGPFHWSRFNVDRIRGDILWAGLELKLRNVQTEFYGGAAGGSAEFQFEKHAPVRYQFAFSTTNSLLQGLIADYFGRTNQLEGFLTGHAVVTSARGDDWRSANGYGQLALRDGLIWDIPVFGIFSPVLNGIAPGLGNSRASEGGCTFALTNGVLHTDDLEIRAPALRLLYKGNIDLLGQVNARVEAELLRDVWLVGPLVSTVFWPVTKMFEYRVTGQINQPRLEPVYLIPKLVLFPFTPFRALKGLLPDNSGPGANAPPSKKP